MQLKEETPTLSKENKDKPICQYEKTTLKVKAVNVKDVPKRQM